MHGETIKSLCLCCDVRPIESGSGAAASLLAAPSTCRSRACLCTVLYYV